MKLSIKKKKNKRKNKKIADEIKISSFPDDIVDLTIKPGEEKEGYIYYSDKKDGGKYILSDSVMKNAKYLSVGVMTLEDYDYYYIEIQ